MLYGMCNLQRKKEQNTFKNEIQLQQCNNPAGKMQTTMDDDDDDSIIIDAVKMAWKNNKMIIFSVDCR